MKERPILFSGPMVRALLSGQKTQTRRVVKMPSGFDFFAGRDDDKDNPVNWGGEDESGAWWALADGDDIDHVLPCPYGQPGDRLWVRETIRKTGEFPGGYATSEYVADGAPTVADAWPWQRPTLVSIHCPRGLSRITLEVTSVRVERLQDISETDAAAEGIIQYEDELGYGTGYPDTDQNIAETASGAFRKLWESINGPGSWGANPWVWVVDFKKGDL